MSKYDLRTFHPLTLTQHSNSPQYFLLVQAGNPLDDDGEVYIYGTTTSPLNLLNRLTRAAHGVRG